MKIAIIGTGYVGLVTGVCLAELGHRVSCVDIDRRKIENLRKGESPIYEPGLDKLIKNNMNNGRLDFFYDIRDGIVGSEIIFIAVGTPSRSDGAVETKYVEQAAVGIGQSLSGYAVIVNKSTVPPGTGEKVRKIISKNYHGEFDVVSNPEFLREGQAISDFTNPDRIVIGTESAKAKKIMRKLYSRFVSKIFFTSLITAEMIKYASNSFLATSISFINGLSELCENIGANVDDVAAGMKLDQRIGPRAFLAAGPGFGGSCFPKDVSGLLAIASQSGIKLPILQAVMEVNVSQGERVFAKIKKLLGSLKNKKVAVWGLAFKPGTDDLRESPAVNLIIKLLKFGAKVSCFDPAAETNGRKVFPKIIFGKTPLETLRGAECLVIMTEWPQFKKIKLSQIKKSLGRPNIVDARNIYKKTEAKAFGLRYEGMGQ